MIVVKCNVALSATLYLCAVWLWPAEHCGCCSGPWFCRYIKHLEENKLRINMTSQHMSVWLTLCVSLRVLLWSLLKRINTISRHLCLTISLLSIRPFHGTSAATRRSSSMDSAHQLGFKELHIRDPFCIRSVPLNHSSDVPHSGTLLSALIHALLPCPMEVIRCAPFLLDHRATGSWYYKCLICNSFCGSAGDAWNLLCRSYQNKAE